MTDTCLSVLMVLRIVFPGARARAKDFGEVPGEDLPDGGHAGTDDADVEFDVRPESNGPVIPGKIGRGGE